MSYDSCLVCDNITNFHTIPSLLKWILLVKILLACFLLRPALDVQYEQNMVINCFPPLCSVVSYYFASVQSLSLMYQLILSANFGLSQTHRYLTELAHILSDLMFQYVDVILSNNIVQYIKSPV